MSFTLTNARTFLQRYDADNSSQKGQDIFDIIANRAKRGFHAAAKFDFNKQRGRCVFNAPKTAGTVSVNVDATAVTGVGTAFAAADVGSFIRFNGEDIQYEITAVGGVTALTLETGGYRGAANLAAVTYEIDNERVALPARFESFEEPRLSGMGWSLEPKTLNELLWRRQALREVSTPRLYAVEWVKGASDTYKTPKMWLYPSPSDKRIVDFCYYEGPTLMSAGADDFGIPSAIAAERLIQEWLLGFLWEEQGRLSEAQVKLAYAEKETKRAAARLRGVSEGPQREPWSTDADPEPGTGRYYDIPLGAGEPFYL